VVVRKKKAECVIRCCDHCYALVMICVAVLYPNESGKKFDHEYYARTHMPLVMDRCKTFGLIRYEIDRGLSGGAPGSTAPFISTGRLYFNSLDEFQKAMEAHGAEIMADVQNYTDIQLQIQVSQMTPS
jgi:uncharacterized protein (TIGR02118 family)